MSLQLLPYDYVSYVLKMRPSYFSQCFVLLWFIFEYLNYLTQILYFTIEIVIPGFKTEV